MADPINRRPDPIDVHVGNHIRARRKHLGISQQDLARAAKISFQQVQKYENAGNRVSASRLAKISLALNTPIGEFFPKDYDAGDLGLGPLSDFGATVGAETLARCWLAMGKPSRAALLHVARALADDIAAEPGAAYVAGGDFEAGRARHVS